MNAISHKEKRSQALAHLDDAKLGWFHLRTVLVAGVGFFTDAYDIFVISQSINVIYQVYYADQISGGWYEVDPRNSTDFLPNKTNYTGQNFQVQFTKLNSYNKHIDALLKASTNWGNLIGQLTFGYLGDKVGRKRMYGVELIIMITCTIASAMCAPAVRGMGIIAALGIWRFFLGIGIGGDYPMSAVITSEFANVRYRGMMLSAVFAMQGIGILVGGMVILVTLFYMQPFIRSDFLNLDYVWRIALGFGAIPGFIALYFRLTIPETPRFTVDVIGDTFKAETDVEKVLALNRVRDVTSNWGKEEVAATKVIVKSNTLEDFCSYFGKWRHLKILLGAAYCWFALDIAFYGIQINQSQILNLINFNGPQKVAQPGGKTTTPGHDISDTFIQIAFGNLIIACAGTVPGYWFSVAFVERMGRKTIQWMGFGIIAVVLAVLAAGWTSIKDNQTQFMVLFTIAQFFFQFGPNTTTFVVPGEVFPTRWRSTGHGICAAAGKAGAILGVQAVGPYFSDNAQTVLGVFSFIMLTGVAATFLIPETKGKTLEELSLEDNVIIEETQVEYISSENYGLSGSKSYPMKEMPARVATSLVSKYSSVARRGSESALNKGSNSSSSINVSNTARRPSEPFYDSSYIGIRRPSQNSKASSTIGSAASPVIADPLFISNELRQFYGSPDSVMRRQTSGSVVSNGNSSSASAASHIRRAQTGYRPPPSSHVPLAQQYLPGSTAEELNI